MPSRAPSPRARTLAGAAAIVVALVGLAVPRPAALVETYYSRGFYVHLQRIVTPVSNLLPFALLDVAGAMAIVVWLAQASQIVRPGRRLAGLGLLTLRFAVFAAVIYVIFLAAWGLNYRRVPLEQKLAFDE